MAHSGQHRKAVALPHGWFHGRAGPPAGGTARPGPGGGEYDSSKQVPFGAYARRRIAGAVTDSLRRNDHLSRAARAKLKASGLEDHTAPVPLLDPNLLPGTSMCPDQDAASTVARLMLRAAIATLPPRLRVVLDARYHRGKTVGEIGSHLGVSVSRVSQLHRQALRDLRRYFDLRGQEMEDFRPQ